MPMPPAKTGRVERDAQGGTASRRDVSAPTLHAKVEPRLDGAGNFCRSAVAICDAARGCGLGKIYRAAPTLERFVIFTQGGEEHKLRTIGNIFQVFLLTLG